MEKISYSELKQIAVDLAEGKIYSNLHLGQRNIHVAINVFMVLIFLDEKARKDLEDREVVFVYEYMDQAGPVAVNGCPTFMSARFMGKEDFHDMMIEYERYIKMRTEFLTDYVPNIPVDFIKTILTAEDVKRFQEEKRERPE